MSVTNAAEQHMLGTWQHAAVCFEAETHDMLLLCLCVEIFQMARFNYTVTALLDSTQFGCVSITTEYYCTSST